MRKKKNPDLSPEVLCAEYQAVYRYALTLCRQENEAQDLTQETFLRAMKAAHTFRGTSSLYTWLCAIAKNLWINRCKTLGREVIPEDLTRLPPDPSPSLEERLSDRETALHLHRILHQLREPYKEVFSLRVFGELSFAHIAALFGKTESWARVTYHRARKMIQAQLEQPGKDDSHDS